jgi:DNA-binding transcriptional LysR family regulator
MDARHLRAFLAVAEYGGFSAAAARLGYAQSSVSDQVRALERELGVSVLLRTHTGTELTEAGTRIRAYAQQIIDIEAQMLRTAAGVRPLLRVGALEPLAARWLPEILTALGAGDAGPATAADVDLVVATREQLAEDLSAGRLDVTFLFGTVVAGAAGPRTSIPESRGVRSHAVPAHGAEARGVEARGVEARGTLSRGSGSRGGQSRLLASGSTESGLVVGAPLLGTGRPAPGPRALVGHDSTVLVVAPHHPLAARDLLAVADLTTGSPAGSPAGTEAGSAPGAGIGPHPDAVFLVTEPGCMYRMVFDRFAREVPGGLRIGAVAESPAALRRMARDGHGIAVLPQVAVADELERGDLVRLNVYPGPATVGIEARWRTGLGPAERPLHGLLRLARRRQPVGVRDGGSGAATVAGAAEAGPLAQAA